MAKQRGTKVGIGFVAIGLTAVLLLAGCSAGSESSSSGSAPVRADSSEGSAPQRLSGENLLNPDASTDSSELTKSAVAPEETAEILTATMSIRVKDPQAAAESIRGIVAGAGGKVSYAVERPGNEYEYGSAQLTLRLPPERLESAMAAIRDTGVVLSSESGSQDVTKQQTDYEVRIQSLQTSIGRLTALLAQSPTTADLIEIERELQSREAELESMTAMLGDLNDQIAYATLNVSLTADSKSALPPKVEPENFFTGFERGLEGLAAFGAGVLVFLGLSLPWILLFGTLGSIVLLVLTSVRKRRRKNTSTLAPSEPTAARAPESEALSEEQTKGNDGRAEEG